MDPDAPRSQVVRAVPVDTEASDGSAEVAATEGQQAITEPAKLLRIASMVRELLEETRQASVDEAGRKRLADIYQRSLSELSGVLPSELKQELEEIAPPLEGVPTESEIRIAQAQLVGWLEGLFHGIQAAMFAQQSAARSQLEELRRRGLPSGMPGTGAEQDGADSSRGSGQYL
jgi:hypothetical protein